MVVELLKNHLFKMAKVYTFGDSFTEGAGCKPDDEYYKKYNKNNELIWPEIVSKHYNAELINTGLGGCSNEIILDKILENWNRIKKEDIVVIGKTFSHRFDIPAFPFKNKLVTVWGPSWFDFPDVKDYPSLDSLKNYLAFYRVDNSLYDNRHCNYFNFLKIQLEVTKNVKVVFWQTDRNIKNVETITTATNGTIIDGHFSYKGHQDFAQWVISKLESTKLKKVNLI
jgi:hypothetical protein